MVKIALCDDEEIQLDNLEKYINEWSKISKREVGIDKFLSAEEFLFDWKNGEEYNIALLDIQMSKMDGIQLAKKIREKDQDIDIIFVTGIPDHISEGYEVSALHYLINPIEKNKLCEVIEKAFDKNRKKRKSIILNNGSELLKVYEDEIVYLESFGHNTEVYFPGYSVNIKKGISQIIEEIKSDLFCRVHRYYYVNMNYIKKILKNSVEIEVYGEIPLSRRMYKEVNNRLLSFIKEDIR